MPYLWSDHGDAPVQKRLDLWPHRSLPRKGFAAFILATFGMITIPLFGMLGTAVLWGLLPFTLLAVGGVWWGLERSYASARLHETLTIIPDRLHLLRTEPSGETQEWECNSYWARVEMHPKGGPVDHYVTLAGKGREVEIGAFLSEEERKALYGELHEALRAAQPPTTHP